MRLYELGAMFLITVAAFAGGKQLGQSQGQEQPDAKTILDIDPQVKEDTYTGALVEQM